MLHAARPRKLRMAIFFTGKRIWPKQAVENADHFAGVGNLRHCRGRIFGINVVDDGHSVAARDGVLRKAGVVGHCDGHQIAHDRIAMLPVEGSHSIGAGLAHQHAIACHAVSVGRGNNYIYRVDLVGQIVFSGPPFFGAIGFGECPDDGYFVVIILLKGTKARTLLRSTLVENLKRISGAARKAFRQYYFKKIFRQIFMRNRLSSENDRIDCHNVVKFQGDLLHSIRKRDKSMRYASADVKYRRIELPAKAGVDDVDIEACGCSVRWRRKPKAPAFGFGYCFGVVFKRPYLRRQWHCAKQ